MAITPTTPVRTLAARPAVQAKAQGPERAPVAGKSSGDTIIRSGSAVAGAAAMGVATFALVGARSGPFGWALLALNAGIGALGGLKLGENLSKLAGEGLKLESPTWGGMIGGLALGGAYTFFALTSAAFGAISAPVVGVVGVLALLGGAKVGNMIEDGIRHLAK